MNAKQIGLSVLLADFLALNAYAAYQYGYVGVFEMMAANDFLSRLSRRTV